MVCFLMFLFSFGIYKPRVLIVISTIINKRHAYINTITMSYRGDSHEDSEHYKETPVGAGTDGYK